MRYVWLFLCGWIGLLPISAREEDTLRLLNGDQIRGTLRGLDSGNLIVTPAGAENTIEIPARFAGFVTRSIPSTPRSQNANVMVRFRNGESFFGRLQALDEETLRLTAPWGGEVIARRSMVRSLEFLRDGANMPIPSVGTLRDWTVEEGGLATETADGIVVEAQSAVSRSFRSFPERFRLDITLRARSPTFLANIVLFSRRGNNPDRDAMAIQFHHGFVTATLHRGRNHEMLFRQPHGRHMQPEMSFTLLGDLAESRFMLFHEGEEMVRWDTPGFAPGTKARPAITFFFPQFAHEIRELRLQRWDGMFPAPGQPLTPRHERLTSVFPNGDQLILKRIEADATRVRLTPFFDVAAALEVPFAQLERIDFPLEPEEMPIRIHRRDVTVTLAPYGNPVTLALTSFGEQGLAGDQDMWMEPLRIPRDFVQRIHFNIHTARRLDGEEMRLIPPMTFP